LFQQLCCVFTAPTARTWQQIALGWILNRGPATVTAVFRTLGDQADRDWTVYEKFFYQAAWCLWALCMALLQRVVYPLLLETAQAAGEVVADLAIDDTTAGRSGKHVAHAGWFKGTSATGPSHRGTEHQAYPYLLRGLRIDHPNQVWSSDITYIRFTQGFVYLKDYEAADEARRGLAQYFRFYNTARPHQALGYRTPAEVHFGSAGTGCNHVTGGNKKEKEAQGQKMLLLQNTCLRESRSWSGN
jgi:transposase InsO family protein